MPGMVSGAAGRGFAGVVVGVVCGRVCAAGWCGCRGEDDDVGTWVDVLSHNSVVRTGGLGGFRLGGIFRA